MKLMHLSDLHIGKKLNDFSLAKDQRYILDQIVSIARQEHPDALLIAGDIYNTAAPSTESMEIWNDFMDRLAELKLTVLVINGNHDSAERLNYAGNFLHLGGIHISPVYNGHIDPILLKDEYGEVAFWLMPYVSPDIAAGYFPEQKISSTNDAVKAIIDEMTIDSTMRNVILTHQFVTGSSTCDSERKSIVGTLEDVDASSYNAFDYVALGHLHRPQNVGRSDGTMRYCGTPLMYSRSEMNLSKSITMVNLGEKGSITVDTIPLKPLREMRLKRGLFEDVLREGAEPGTEDDLFIIELTDEDDIPNAMARLRERFHNILELLYDNRRTRNMSEIDLPENAEEKNLLDLMMDLYQQTHHKPMDESAIAFVTEMIREMEAEEK